MGIKLIEYLPEHKYIIEECKKGFTIFIEDDFGGFVSFDNEDEYNEWLEYVEEVEDEDDEFIPGTTYFAFNEEDNKLVGIMDIRHRLNKFLSEYGGHIGYSVITSERGKGYGTKMLALALEECKNFNICNVLVTCTSDNIASQKIILKNGFKYENDVLFGNRSVKRYWKELKK